jgi:hypothetical protein
LFHLPGWHIKSTLQISPCMWFPLLKRESNYCEAHNLVFCLWMSKSKWKIIHLSMIENYKHLDILWRVTHSHFRSLLSHNGCLLEFCIDKIIICHDTHFLQCCLVHLYAMLNAHFFACLCFSFNSKPLPGKEKHCWLQMQCSHTHAISWTCICCHSSSILWLNSIWPSLIFDNNYYTKSRSLLSLDRYKHILTLPSSWQCCIMPWISNSMLGC